MSHTAAQLQAGICHALEAGDQAAVDVLLRELATIDPTTAALVMDVLAPCR